MTIVLLKWLIRYKKKGARTLLLWLVRAYPRRERRSAVLMSLFSVTGRRRLTRLKNARQYTSYDD